MSREESFLRLAHVTKRRGDRVVVDRALLCVAEGELIAVLGPSGYGRTTTLRIIAGLEKPDQGEIWVAGRNRYFARCARAQKFKMGCLARPAIASTARGDNRTRSASASA